MINFNTTLNLVLTGFMGTGKTTIGRIVAEQLGRRFVDLDQIIMQRSGRTIPEIFQELGEPTFRAWEAAFCQEFSEPAGLVIATGGGTLVPTENYQVMAKPGNVIVCLTVEPEALLARLTRSRERPLAKDPSAVLDLLKKRTRAYQRIRLKLDTTNLKPDTIATAVIHLFDRELERNSIRTMVQTPGGAYEILCMPGLLQKIPYILESYDLNNRVIVATNETIAPLYGKPLVDALPNAALVTIPDGETYKNLATVEGLYRDFVKAGLDRSGIVIALGGGVVGDTVGYAAASYMRGVQLIQIPTSLLAMVDSSVGGKVGVDIPEGKNLVGAFKQPEMVIIDPDVLKTLPPVEIQCGLAETIKHGLLADPGLLDCLYQVAAGDADLLRRAIQVKVDVVQRDPYEEGERAHLNLGHTFAHAVERVSGYQWRHGEAVGLGLVAAARLSTKISSLSPEAANRIETIVAEMKLPVSLNGFDSHTLWEAMHTDKKWRSGHSQFVILEDIGKPAVVKDVSRDIVLEVLDSLKK